MLLDRNVTAAAGKSNVLLLGISYPCVQSQMNKRGVDPSMLTYKEPSVEQAVECVRRNILTEMDARDLARCVAVEQATNTQVYTVSRESGAVYNDRHIHCDFNTRNFCKKLINKFGEGIQFSQVILDYYWMPSGWLVTRWAKALFQETLPDLVRYQMLTFPSTRKRRRNNAGPPYDIDEGVVFLPFCAHVCKELVGAVHILEQYYEITFLDKKDLHGHSLWKGTMEIDGEVMQHRLGKRLDQEEIYCKFRPKDIYESMEDPHVSKPAVMRILLAIKNYDDVRMVRLRPLRQHEQANVFRERMWEPEKGGFMGLDFELSARLMKEQKKGRKSKTPLAIEEEKKENDQPKVNQIEAQTKPKKKSKPEKKEKRQKKPAIKIVPKTVTDEELSTSQSDDEAGERRHSQYFPGPVQDLDTYTEMEDAIAQDLDDLAAFRIKQKRLEKKNALKSLAAKERGKGVILLPEYNLKTHRRHRQHSGPEIKTRDFLSFNPRAPKERPEVEIFDEMELDYSVIPEDEQNYFFGNDTESDDEMEKAHDVQIDPFLADAMDLAAASNLYHGILKGYGTATDNDGVGVERKARIKINNNEIVKETVCYSLNINQVQAETQRDFDQFEPNHDDGEEAHIGEVSRLLSACLDGKWEEIVVAGDVDGSEMASSRRWPSRVLQLRTTDGDKYEVKVDRLRNLRFILRWLVRGQNDHDDQNGMLRFHYCKLSTDSDFWSMSTVAQASLLEERLLEQIASITKQLASDLGGNAKVNTAEDVLDLILEQFPNLSAKEVAPTLLCLGYNHAEEDVPILLSLRGQCSKDFTPRFACAHETGKTAFDGNADYSLAAQEESDSSGTATTMLELYSRGQKRPLIHDHERNLISTYLFGILKQFEVCFEVKSDFQGSGGEVEPSFGGIACTYCSTRVAGSTTASRSFFPDRKSPLSQQKDFWRSLISHLSTCDWCPMAIKSRTAMLSTGDAALQLVQKDFLFLDSTLQNRMSYYYRSEEPKSHDRNGLAVVVTQKSKKKERAKQDHVNGTTSVGNSRKQPTRIAKGQYHADPNKDESALERKGYRRSLLVDELQKLDINNIPPDIKPLKHPQHQRRLRNKKGFSSEYHGIYYQKKTKKWVIRLNFGGSFINLGSCDSELEAARYYAWAKSVAAVHSDQDQNLGKRKRAQPTGTRVTKKYLEEKQHLPKNLGPKVGEGDNISRIAPETGIPMDSRSIIPEKPPGPQGAKAGSSKKSTGRIFRKDHHLDILASTESLGAKRRDESNGTATAKLVKRHRMSRNDDSRKISQNVSSSSGKQRAMKRPRTRESNMVPAQADQAVGQGRKNRKASSSTAELLAPKLAYPTINTGERPCEGGNETSRLHHAHDTPGRSQALRSSDYGLSPILAVNQNQIDGYRLSISAREKALEKFSTLAGFSRDFCTNWINAVRAEMSPSRAALLQRICIWLGSDRRIYETEAENYKLHSLADIYRPPMGPGSVWVDYVLCLERAFLDWGQYDSRNSSVALPSVSLDPRNSRVPSPASRRHFLSTTGSPFLYPARTVTPGSSSPSLLAQRLDACEQNIRASEGAAAALLNRIADRRMNPFRR